MKTLITYFSKYGQTEKIAKRIAEVIQSSGETVHLNAVGQILANETLADYDRIILGSPIYAHSHSREIAAFIKKFRNEMIEQPTAFFSVSASAAGDEKQLCEVKKLFNQFLRDCDFVPDHVTIFAGALPYREYNWFLRMMMKWIVSRAGGDTDTSKNYEYTDWERVEEFARSVMKISSVEDAA